VGLYTENTGRQVELSLQKAVETGEAAGLIQVELVRNKRKSGQVEEFSVLGGEKNAEEGQREIVIRS
jgi:hypothetical protein